MSFQQPSGSTNHSANSLDNYDRQSINSGSGSIATLNDELSSTVSSLSGSSFQPGQQLTSSVSTDFIKLQQQEKIIQDYVKLRNKLTILKNAYKELSETSVQKDQALRKYEQEIESLNFRNQQLTSRVENLQKELLDATSSAPHSLPTNGSAGNGGNQLYIPSTNNISTSPVNPSALASLANSSTTTNSSGNSLAAPANKMQRNNSNVSTSSQSKLDVMSEELQHKIDENVALNRRLNEIEVEFRQKLAKNEHLLKQIEGEKLVLEKKLESTDSSSKILIEKLQNDKIKLELTVIQLENQLRTLYQESSTTNGDSTAHNGAQEAQRKASNPEPSIPEATKTAAIAESSVEGSVLADIFHTQVDCLSKIYVCLDEIAGVADGTKPRQHTKLALKCDQLLKQQLIPLLSQQASKSRPTSPSPSSPSAVQHQLKADFDRLLNEFFDSNHSLIQTVTSEMASSSQSSNEMDIINKKLKIYLTKLDTFLFVNSSQGSSSSSLNSTQNNSGHSSPGAKDSTSPASFASQIAKLLHIVLFSKSSQVQQVVQLVNSSAFQRGLSTFIDILEKLLFVYNEKLSLEYSLEYSTTVVTNDECIVSYLTQFKQTLNQFVGFLEAGSTLSLNEAVTRLVNHVNKLTESENDAHVKGVNIEEEVEQLREKLAEKEKELHELQDKYEQLKSKALNDVQDIERLKSKLEQMQTQFLKQKQDNQALSKELDELKQRSQEQQQQNDDLIKQQIELQSLKSMSNSNSDQSIGLQREPEIIEKVEAPVPAAPVSDERKQVESVGKLDDASERLTIEFCMNKIDELNQQIRILDGKALFYYEEMNSVLERLRMQSDESTKQENELAEVKDQLERTRNTYETQISTMSEHLISVNETLTKHAEENERLKLELMSRNNNNNISSNTPLLSATGSSANSKSSSKKKAK